MLINKDILFNNFFGKNKNRKVFIGIDNILNINDYMQFLNLFNSRIKKVFYYDNILTLEKSISTFNDNIFILLTQQSIFLQNIKNDSRFFIFYITKNGPPSIKINNVTNIVNFNLVIEKYTLLNAYINYEVLNNDLYVNISKFHGFGLYTSKKILKGKKLFKLNGKIVSQDIIKNKNFTGEWNALSNNLYLVRNNRTSYGFINHSRLPNCIIDTNSMEVLTLCNIEKGTELLLDYRNEPLSEDYLNRFGKLYL